MKYPFPLVVYIRYKENKFYLISNDFFFWQIFNKKLNITTFKCWKEKSVLSNKIRTYIILQEKKYMCTYIEITGSYLLFKIIFYGMYIFINVVVIM